VSKVAVDFVRHVLQQNPNLDSFGAVYDAMSRAACSKSFNNLGHHELSRAGVSLSLLNTANLERLIAEARRTMK